MLQTLVSPSGPVLHWITRSSDQVASGKRSSIIMTMSLTCKFLRGCNHFDRRYKSQRTSTRQRRQKSSRTFCINNHLSVGVLDGSSHGEYGAGNIWLWPPIRKWPGVNAMMSLALFVSGLNGLEFIQVSIYVASVESSSNVSSKSPATRRKWCLKELTLYSQSPPWFGAFGGILEHSTPSAFTVAETSLIKRMHGPVLWKLVRWRGQISPPRYT